jgi:hypothetical protein
LSLLRKGLEIALFVFNDLNIWTRNSKPLISVAAIWAKEEFEAKSPKIKDKKLTIIEDKFIVILHLIAIK